MSPRIAAAAAGFAARRGSVAAGGLGLAALAVGIVCTAAAEPASADGFSSLPGADRYELVRARMRQMGRGGEVAEVRFASPGDGDGEGEGVFFRRGREWFEVDLESGGAEAVAADAVPPAASRGSSDPPRRRAPRGRQLDRETSPDGRLVAEHREHNLWLADADGGEARAVTTDGTPLVRYGRASWVYGEELDQDTAMWWSPDSSMLAFYRFDDSAVPPYHLLKGLADLRTEVMTEFYPKAGDPNPVAGLIVLEVASGRLVEIDVGGDGEAYIYGVRFSPDGSKLLFLRLDRPQRRLELVAADPRTGESRTVLEERQESWQRHDPTLRFLADGRRFIWSSESSGWNHLELWDLEQGRLAVLTRGAFPVESIVQVDEARGVLHFTARCGEHPLDSQLCRVSLDGQDRRMLTPGDRHFSGFRIAPDLSSFVAVEQSLAEPPRTVLFSERGERLAVLAEGESRIADDLGLPPPELFAAAAADGETTLFGTIHKPSNFDPSRRWPLLLEVYGGPRVNTVSNRYRPADPSCELGFVVVRVDNRGTPGRGKAFEAATYRRLGVVDLDDQAAAIRQLLEARPYLDPERVGIAGFSYGGTMALLGLLRHPDLFRAGFAGAPVTDWRNYDSIYTERYMGTPQENPEGYRESSAVELAGNLRGDLLLVHGMVDHNVHPANAWQLAAALQGRDLPFEMMFFPNSAHGIASPSMQRIRWSFLQRALGAGPR
jgi:dipeptidyl-peptidase-4